MDGLSEQALDFYRNCAKLDVFPVFLVYLALIFLIPVWKKLLPVFDLKPLMIVYNVVCVGLSGAAAYYSFYGVYQSGSMYKFSQNNSITMGMFLYALSKAVELLDTVFMVLRHKWRQISFLHVFHHSTILVLGNYSYYYVPIVPIAISLGLNSVVHVFLYAYYALSAFSPQGVNPVWKKRLTQFQIAQFLFGLVFVTNGYFYHRFCIYSIFYDLSMLVLFSNFYCMAYIKKKSEKKSE